MLWWTWHPTYFTRWFKNNWLMNLFDGKRYDSDVDYKYFNLLSPEYHYKLHSRIVLKVAKILNNIAMGECIAHIITIWNTIPHHKMILRFCRSLKLVMTGKQKILLFNSNNPSFFHSLSNHMNNYDLIIVVATIGHIIIFPT